MAGWVIITIRITRSFYKTHNIFVAHALMLCAFIFTLLSGTMTVGYSTGMGDFIGCNVFVSMFYPAGILC